MELNNYKIPILGNYHIFGLKHFCNYSLMLFYEG